MTLDELLTKIVNKSYNDLLAYANKALSCIQPELARIVGDETALKAVLLVITTCCAADGVLTPLEKQFLTDLIGIDPSDARRFVADNNDPNFVRNLISVMNYDMKKHCVMLCASCFAVDETISKDEIIKLKLFFEID